MFRIQNHLSSKNRQTFLVILIVFQLLEKTGVMPRLLCWQKASCQNGQPGRPGLRGECVSQQFSANGTTLTGERGEQEQGNKR